MRIEQIHPEKWNDGEERSMISISACHSLCDGIASERAAGRGCGTARDCWHERPEYQPEYWIHQDIIVRTPAVAAFSNATMVLPVGPQLWLGTFPGDRIADGALSAR